MSATDDLNNPHLFDENEPGNYTYTETAYGKTASGQLHTATSPDRDALAQRTAGGEDRRTAGGMEEAVSFLEREKLGGILNRADGAGNIVEYFG